MRRTYRHVLLPVLLPLVGCGPDLPDGVWQFSVYIEELPEDTCATTVTHNFETAWVPEAEEVESDWSSTAESLYSEQVVFALVTTTGPDTATMVVGDLAYPGSLQVDGTWRFTWAGSSGSTSRDEHTSGYVYAAAATETDQVTFDLLLEDGMATGDVSETVTSSQSWTESDAWSQEVMDQIGTTGQIPASSYLVTSGEDYDGDGYPDDVPAYNSGEVWDCRTDECTLNVNSTCDWSYTVSGVRTALDDGEAFRALEDAGQDAGA